MRKPRLVFITRSFDRIALACGRYDTSSASYEIDLLRVLRNWYTITVLPKSYAFIGQETHLRRNKGLVFAEIAKNFAGKAAFLLGAVARSARTSREVVVFTTGYYLDEMILLAVARLMGARTFVIVFDSHAAALCKMGFIKRCVAQVFFQSGLAAVRFQSGVVVVNRNAHNFFGPMPPPLHLSRIGGHVSEYAYSGFKRRDSDAPVRFLFAGTLNNENGVDVFLNAVGLTTGYNFQFIVCGSGPLEDEVRALCERDARFRFLGRIPDSELVLQIEQADGLICLRDPNAPCRDISFPSKLIKFMASGVPTIANEFSAVTPQMCEHLVMMADFTSQSLADKMLSFIYNDYAGLAESGKHFIAKNHDWYNVGRDMNNFILSKFSESHL